MFRTLTLLIIASTSCLSVSAQTNTSPIKHKQIIRSAENPQFETENPRYVTNTPTNELLVVSGDSNALTVFKPDTQTGFLYSQSFSKQHNDKLALEGASDISYESNNGIAIVSSFYSGSLSTFKRNAKGFFTHIETLSDHIDIKQAFRNYEKVTDKDTLKLLGAWDSLISKDNKTLYVASYQSNSVSKFEVQSSGKLNHLGQLMSNYDWGKPTSIVQSNDTNWLYVNGFEQSKISVLHKGETGKYTLSQTIVNGKDQIQTMQNPQQIASTPNNQYLFVAASKSNALNVFKRNTSKQFELIQSINQQQTNGLSGACCVVYSDKHNLVFAAGEADKGLLLFKQSPKNGQLILIDHIKHSNTYDIKGVSSISLSQDQQSLYVSTGKNNEIFIFELP
ncbi:hypothetical protein S4054249_09780 [Pseudoalteromonas luteoviolacea]|nr:hypothetical protein S4054249_09780 [Pseudoalteromonas luteoviolacea]